MAIYDCFTFFNEIDLLRIRLNVLAPFVDKFIIVELPKTFRGDDKELVFAKNKQMFSKYLNKIIYITEDYVPDYLGDGSFNIEHYQRNLILKGLEQCKPDDIIIISDIDEIPDMGALHNMICLKYRRSGRKMTQCIKTLMYEFALNNKDLVKDMIKGKKKNCLDWLDITPIALEQSLFYYYMNCRSKELWYGPVITMYKNMELPQRLRDKRNLLPFIESAGWHFSYLGGVTSVKSKLRSIVDKNPDIVAKLDTCSKDEAYIEECLKNGTDILGRKGKQFEYEFIDFTMVGLPGINEIKKEYANLFMDY